MSAGTETPHSSAARPSRYGRWPARFVAALREIDAERETPGGGRPAEYRVAVTMLTVGVCLLLIHYLKLSTAFRAALELVDPTGGIDLRNAVYSHRFAQLFSLAWWGWWHLIGYLLIPWLVIRCVFHERLADHGLGLGRLGRHWHWYLLLLAPILVLVAIASFRDDFTAHYPFYHLAWRSWFELLAWETIYLSQFVFLEFFFRGFMLRSLQPSLGVNAVFVMCVPYLMIHFTKPWPEAAGAILFGLFLGVLALRSRSIWGGVAVHAGVALGMDLAALLQTRGLPRVWWP